MITAPALPKVFNAQAHLYSQYQEASATQKKALEKYEEHISSRVRRTQEVARSVLAKELGLLTFTLNSTHHAPYLPISLRWVLDGGEVKPTPRDILLRSWPLPHGRIQEVTAPQELLTLSDRDVAKMVRTSVREKKEQKAESIKFEARLLNQKRRQEAERRIYRLEAELKRSRKQLDEMRG